MYYHFHLLPSFVINGKKSVFPTVLLIQPVPISHPGALKTSRKLTEEKAEDTDSDGSHIPEDITQVRIRKNTPEYYGSQKCVCVYVCVLGFEAILVALGLLLAL